MKKRFAVMAMAVASAAALAACSGSEEAAATTAAQASEAAEETTAAGEAEETEAEASEEAGGAEASADGRTVIKFYKQDGGNGAPPACFRRYGRRGGGIAKASPVARPVHGRGRWHLRQADRRRGDGGAAPSGRRGL